MYPIILKRNRQIPQNKALRSALRVGINEKNSFRAKKLTNAKNTIETLSETIIARKKITAINHHDLIRCVKASKSLFGFSFIKIDSIKVAVTRTPPIIHNAKKISSGNPNVFLLLDHPLFCFS